MSAATASAEIRTVVNTRYDQGRARLSRKTCSSFLPVPPETPPLVWNMEVPVVPRHRPTFRSATRGRTSTGTYFSTVAPVPKTSHDHRPVRRRGPSSHPGRDCGGGPGPGRCEDARGWPSLPAQVAPREVPELPGHASGRLAAVTVSRRNVLNVFARVSVYHATISYIIATELLFQYFFFFFLIGFSSPKLVIFFARFCTN